MLDWNRWLPGLGTDEPEEEESAVSKTLKALGQGVSDAGSAVSQGISDAGSAISSGISSAAQTVQDAYAVPTEQRPPQYSGPSYAQPAMGAPQPAQDALTEQVVKPAASLLDAAMGPEGILEPAGGVIRTTGRISDLQNQASGELGRSPIDPRVLDDPGWRARHPDEAAEADSLKQQNTLGLMGQVGEVPRAAQRAAGVLEAAAPAPRPAAVPEPPVRLSNAERMAAADARMAEQGSTAAPGVFGLSGIEPGRPEVQGMRPRIIPEDVADQLDYPIRPPTDPAVIRAIVAAGGTVDERGTTLNVIRMSDPEAAGGAATRSMVFYTAGPPGAPSEYAREGTVGPQGVGGSQRIEGRTRFRNPLFISDAPGEAAGFDDAMQQMVEPRLQAAQQGFDQATADWEAAMRSGAPNLKEVVDDAFAARQQAYDRLAEARATTPPVATAEAVESGIRAAKRTGPAGSPERAQALKDLVTRYGGDPEVIDDLIGLRGAEMGESAYAVKENIVAGNARRAGHDGVITMQPREAAWDDILAHPEVKAAHDAEQAALTAQVEAQRAHNARPTAENWRAFQRAEAGQERATAASKAAWEQAKQALRRGEITELADPREARNPTPGEPTAALKAAYRRAKDAEARFNEMYQGPPRGEEEFAAARREVEDANAAVDALMNETETPPGYTLRPDIPRRAGRLPEGFTLEPSPDGSGRWMLENDAGDILGERYFDTAEEARAFGISQAAGSTTAQASAGALPAAGRSDPLATVNRVLSQGVVSSVSGGVGAQVNQEMNPDDPYAGVKGFAAGALVPPLAARGGRALARAAGAVPSPGGGALATIGTPGAGGYQPGPGFFARFPGAQQAMAAAQQRAASMQARGVTPLGPLELARKTAAQVGYSSMIGPTTFTTSMLGGPLEMAWSVPKRAAGAALPRALGGRGSLPEALAIGRGGVAGLAEVGGAIVDALKGTGRYAATPGHEPLSAQIVNPIGHAAASALEAGGRFWSGVPDAIYGTIGRKMGEARAAAEAATDAGLTGTSWRQHVDDLLADAKAVQGGQLPTMSATQDVISAGEKAGKRSTYQDDLGAIGQNVKDVATLAVVPDGKGGRKPVPIVGNMIAPFFNTPWNMEARLAEKVPGVGALMTTQKGFDKAYDQVMGTALVAGMGTYAAAGNITGSGPDDPEKRKMLQAQGWRPYSTNIAGYYIPNRALGEFGPLLNAVGDAHDAMTYSEDTSFPGVASNFGARIGKQMQERVWLQGLSELIGALEAGQQGGLGAGAERYAASLATRMVPYAATARTIGTALDPQARTTDRGKETSVGQRIGQQVQRGLGLGQGVPSLGIAPLPVEQDILGRPQANPQQGAGALFPRVGVEKPEPISKAYLEGGVDIGGPPPTIGGIALTPAQQRRWNAARGQALQQARADILAARTLPKAERQAELRRILSEASADARDTVEPTFTERQRRDAERKAS